MTEARVGKLPTSAVRRLKLPVQSLERVHLAAAVASVRSSSGNNIVEGSAK
jgi:hypothetical protein